MIEHEITLDMQKGLDNTPPRVVVRRGDNETQTIEATIVKNGEAYTPNIVWSARFRVLHADGTWALQSASRKNNVATVTLKNATLNGTGRCKLAYFEFYYPKDISTDVATQDDYYIETTQTFELIIEENVDVTGEGAQYYSEELDALYKKYLAYYTTAENAETKRASAESARVAAENARATAETARVNAEKARATAESARASAESARATAESARVTAEKTRVSESKTVLDNANTALANANSAVTKANSAVTSANNAASAANDAADEATTAAETIDTKIATKADKDHTHNYAGSDSAGGAATQAKALTIHAGSTSIPVYFDNTGKPTPCSQVAANTASFLGKQTVGSGVNPVYFSTGAATASASTVGSSSEPVYLNNGTITKCSSITANSATTATTATTASKLGSTTVGSTTTPIYLNSGTAVASGATVGSTTTPIYLNTGKITSTGYSFTTSSTSTSTTSVPTCSAVNTLVKNSTGGITSYNILYSSTTYSSATLTYSAANYTYLEIFFYAGTVYNSVKVYSPNYKNVACSVNKCLSTGMWTYCSYWYISGTSLKCQANYTFNNTVEASSGSNEVYIYRVVGYK